MQDTKRVKNPRKQRKMLFNAPAHIRHKHMGAPLSRELAASKGAKTLPLRKGDTVRIQRGDNKGFEGKVSRVDLKAYRIYLEGLTREKVDGTNIFLPIHPSKVEIRNLSLDDKWRKEILGRKQAPEKAAKKAEKPKEKSVKKAEKTLVQVEEVPEKEPKSTVAQDLIQSAEIDESVVKKEPAKKATAKKPAAKSKKILTKETEAKPSAPKGRTKRKTSEKGVE